MDRCGPKLTEDCEDGRTCPACGEAFRPGDYTVLITLGPGDDTKARTRRDQGRPYNAVASEVHWECASAEARGE